MFEDKRRWLEQFVDEITVTDEEWETIKITTNESKEYILKN